MAYRDSEALVQYLPSSVREDYVDAVQETSDIWQETSGSVPGLGSFRGIKSLDDWAKYRGISPDDLSMLRSEAHSQKRSQMAMRNDPDARGFGDSWNPEYIRQPVTDNPFERLGRRGLPKTIETYEKPIWDIPHLRTLGFKRGEYIPNEDKISFPVGEPKIQAHEYMHRRLSNDPKTSNFIVKEIIQGDLGKQSDYGNEWFATIGEPLRDIHHLYIMEKTAPNFFTDKTDKEIQTMDKQERDLFLKNHFSKLFPEYENEEKFTAFRKAVVEKIDQHIRDNYIKPKPQETPRRSYKSQGRVSGEFINYGDYGRSYK
tara:strand:+ start:296 stop:1240 length:945 start_codon:yes stop_codon:yes gene_type:complete